jgi:hypothetical protein
LDATTILAPRKEIAKIQKRYLPSPSLNEVNYLAFGEVTEEYHQELYGFLFMELGAKSQCDFNQELIGTYKLDSPKKWIREGKKGEIKTEDASLPYYIRNKIDHPENQNNDAFTLEELRDSIHAMQTIFEKISDD